MKCNSFFAAVVSRVASITRSYLQQLPIKRFIKFSFVLGLALYMAPSAHALILTVAQTAGGPGKDYSLSWDAATPSTTTAVTTYFIYAKFGADTVSVVPANLVGSVVGKTAFVYHGLAGTRSFVVRSVDSLDATFNQTSNIINHHFIHTSPLNDGSTIKRTDGDGTQRGVNQLWKFSYFLD